MNDFKGWHLEGQIIVWAVRWYCRYGVSTCKLEEMLEERGVVVDHTTIYRWTQRYAPEAAPLVLGLATLDQLAVGRDLCGGARPLGLPVPGNRQARRHGRLPSLAHPER